MDHAPGERRAGLVFGPRRTPLWLSSVALVAVAAVILALSGGGNGGPSIIAQAYAATSSDGVILHYVVVTTTLSSNTAPTSAALAHSRTEVWQSGQRSHIFRTLAVRQRYGHESVNRNEVTVNGSAIEYYIAGGPSSAGTLIRTTVPPDQLPCDSILELLVTETGNTQCSPISALRALYSSGGLRAAGHATLGGRTVDVIKKGHLRGFLPSWQVIILVDPHTFAPLQMRVSSPGYLDVTRFEDYERVPLNAQSTKLLAMSPHPAARVITIPPRKPSRL
jgi:hypothetical protein